MPTESTPPESTPPESTPPESTPPDATPPAQQETGFAGLPRRSLDDLSGVRAALLGIAEASPYTPGEPSHSAGAPAALRRASALYATQVGQYDFDLEADFLKQDRDAPRLVDCGDLPTDPGTPEANRARITAAIRGMLDAGVVPVVVGGDDSVPIPVFAAYEGHGPLTILQVDAHVDWGDVIKGNPYGYGSPMRRAAELPWIAGMVQVGIRGLGSGTADQIVEARGWGSRIVTDPALRRHGMAPVVAMIPEGGDVIVTIDCDGLDPVAMPAVAMPTPGGPDYGDMLDLLRGVAARARIRGVCLVEFVPQKDVGEIGALTAARLLCTVLGLLE